MSTFAERLKTLRRAAGLSQTELAGDGISPSYVSLLESGRRRPSPAVANLLAAKLGCSLSELLDGEPSERDRRVELELSYAELALRHDASTDAMGRLENLLSEPDLPRTATSRARLLLARAQEQTGDLSGAIDTLTRLLDEVRGGEDAVPFTQVAMFLCYCQASAGDLVRAVTTGEQALDTCREQGLDGTDEYFMLASTVMLAYSDMGDQAHASNWARQLIAEAETAAGHKGRAAIYWNASTIAEREGRIEDALQLSQKAIAYLSELGESRDLARLKLTSASVLLATDPPQVGAAREALERAKGELRRLGSEFDLVEWEQVRSTVALLDGDLAAAETFARSAIDRLPEGAGSEQLSLAHRALGDALAAGARGGDAVDHYLVALDLNSLREPGRASALFWRDLAERLRALGEVEAAVRAYRGALDAAGVRDRTAAILEAIASDAPRSPTETSAGEPDEHRQAPVAEQL